MRPLNVLLIFFYFSDKIADKSGVRKILLKSQQTKRNKRLCLSDKRNKLSAFEQFELAKI